MIVDQKNAIEILKNGGVIGIPTDTVYGFASLKEYGDKIYEIKKRDKNKKLITMINNIDYFSNLDDFLIESMKLNWPGSTTYIFDYKNEMTSFRIPDEINLLNLLNELECGILTTSANISGNKPCLTSFEFETTFPDVPLLEESIYTIKSGTPSTILLYNNKVLKKIR
ncbi:MAG: Sua5/YciO/YrdC/YwlC family protein [Mycoplasmatales bacterium]